MYLPNNFNVAFFVFNVINVAQASSLHRVLICGFLWSILTLPNE